MDLIYRIQWFRAERKIVTSPYSDFPEIESYYDRLPDELKAYRTTLLPYEQEVYDFFLPYIITRTPFAFEITNVDSTSLSNTILAGLEYSSYDYIECGMCKTHDIRTDEILDDNGIESIDPWSYVATGK